MPQLRCRDGTHRSTGPCSTGGTDSEPGRRRHIASAASAIGSRWLAAAGPRLGGRSDDGAEPAGAAVRRSVRYHCASGPTPRCLRCRAGDRLRVRRVEATPSVRTAALHRGAGGDHHGEHRCRHHHRIAYAVGRADPHHRTCWPRVVVDGGGFTRLARSKQSPAHQWVDAPRFVALTATTTRTTPRHRRVRTRHRPLVRNAAHRRARARQPPA